MSIEPTPSFPSLRTLLERLPDDAEEAYTNGSLFDDDCAEAVAGETVIDRPTPTPVVIGRVRSPQRRSRSWLAAPLAFVLGVGATLTIDRALGVEPATAQTAALATTIDDATASLRLVTEVAVVHATPSATGRAARGALAATPIEPAATPIEPAATPIEPAATPIEPAGTAVEAHANDSARAEARGALSDALLGDGAPTALAFDRASARLAVNAAASAAKTCGDGQLTGDATVTVTFAHSGRATSALVSGTLAGTEIGSCIANVMRGASVPAYEGDLVSVRRLVRIR